MGNCFSEFLRTIVTDMYNVLKAGLKAFARESTRHMAYVYRLVDNLEDLERTVGDVRVFRNDLMRRVIVAEKGPTPNLRRPEKTELWFERVAGEITKGDELMKEREPQLKRLILGGVLSTKYCSSSVFGGKVVKCRKNLADLRVAGDKLIEEGLMTDAATADQSIRGTKIDVDETVGSDAKFIEVLTSLKDEKVGIVGLCGHGGVGKTTVLKKINNLFVDPESEVVCAVDISKDFVNVVWIDMGQYLELVDDDDEIRRIQEDIREKFGILKDWRKESTEQMAAYISEELEKEKFLLLLDNIKKPIDLSKIGVPRPSAKGSKVVFTTRMEKTCEDMKVNREQIITVKPLSEHDAWKLFLTKVGDDILKDDGSRIMEYANIVANKCERLPLALKIIGRAMSRKTDIVLWEHASKSFEHLSEEDGTQIDKVCSILRYSYDNLPSQTHKSCFLYCALYSGGSRILKSFLVETWSFEEFMIHSDEPEVKGRNILHDLCGACLCEDRGRYIRLHDVVRHMALRIAKEDTLVKAGMSLREAPSSGRGEWKRMKRVSLMGNNIRELTEVPVCPHLLTLILFRNRQLHSICDGFFGSMGKLGVLNLSATDVQHLPKSISRLVSLKYLDISFTRIRELPIGLRKLIRLKFLNVNGLSLVFKTSKQVIRYLKDLRVLMINCKYCYDGKRVPKTGKVKENDEMLLEELQCLDQLNALEIRIDSSPGLDMLSNTRKLLEITTALCLFGFKAQLDVPKLSETPKLPKITTFLCLWGFKAQPDVPPAPAPAPAEPMACMDVSAAAVATMERLKVLEIRSCEFKELKFYSPDRQSTSSASGTFYNIDVVLVKDCKHLQDLTWLVLFPNLTGLNVSNCARLTDIISGGERNPHHLKNLERLTLSKLPHLKSIYPDALPLRFLRGALITRRTCQK